MAGITLAAGGLIGIERNDRRLLTILKRAQQLGDFVVIPAPALAQVWRGPRSAQISAFLKQARIEILDEDLAKEAGMLCGRTGTSDIVDAAVVIVAGRQHHDIVTSDTKDLQRLKQHVRSAGRIVRV